MGEVGQGQRKMGKSAGFQPRRAIVSLHGYVHPCVVIGQLRPEALNYPGVEHRCLRLILNKGASGRLYTRLRFLI
jgi:hypothetical protein